MTPNQPSETFRIKTNSNDEVVITRATFVPELLAIIAEKGTYKNQLNVCYVAAVKQTEIATALLYYLSNSFGWYESERRQEEREFANPTGEKYKVKIWIVTIEKHGAIRND